MNPAPIPSLRSLHRWSGLLAAAIVSLSVLSGLLNLFAAVDAEQATTHLALQPAALTSPCASVGVRAGDAGRCAVQASAVVAQASPVDDAPAR